MDIEDAFMVSNLFSFSKSLASNAADLIRKSERFSAMVRCD